MQRFSRKWQSLSLLALSSLLLSVFLVACGDSSSATADSAPAPTKAASSNTSQSDSSNTSQSDSNTSQSDSNTSQSDSSLQTYTGNGFTIGYPKDWKVAEDSSAGQVSFTAPTGDYGLAIGVTDNAGGDAATALQSAVQGFEQQSNMSNIQDSTTVPPTTLAGETWQAQAIDGDVQGLHGTFAFMKAMHASKGFGIIYSGPQNGFDQADKTYFQPMLQSFTFTS